MNSTEYLNKLQHSLERFFDIELDKTLGGRDFNLFGKYFTRNAKYFALKKVEVYSFTINEYLLYNNCNRLDVDYINELKEYVKDHVDDIVIKDKEHMSSGITFLISSEENPDKETIKAIKRFKFYKSYNFGFKGWVNVKLIFINIKDNQAFSNKLGRRESKKFIFTK